MSTAVRKALSSRIPTSRKLSERACNDPQRMRARRTEAEILEKKGDRIRVKFIDDNTTRWVAASEVRPWKPRAHFDVGTKVTAQAEEEDDQKHPKFHAATVVRTYHGLFEVHFDNSAKYADQCSRSAASRGLIVSALPYEQARA